MVEGKQCSRCPETDPDKFYPGDGYCKKCRSEYSKQYRENRHRAVYKDAGIEYIPVSRHNKTVTNLNRKHCDIEEKLNDKIARLQKALEEQNYQVMVLKIRLRNKGAKQ